MKVEFDRLQYIYVTVNARNRSFPRMTGQFQGLTGQSLEWPEMAGNGRKWLAQNYFRQFRLQTRGRFLRV